MDDFWTLMGTNGWSLGLLRVDEDNILVQYDHHVDPAIEDRIVGKWRLEPVVWDKEPVE